MEENKEIKPALVCASAEGPTFLWLEFLDPRDGISFAAEVTGPSVLPRWFNITDYASPEYKKCAGSFPKRPSIPVLQRKDTNDYTGYLCKDSGQTGGIMFAKRVDKRKLPINMKLFSNPKLACGENGPNVYIISGHGAQGRIYGEGKLAGELFLRDLAPDQNLRVLIMPCCNNGAFSRLTLLARLFKKSNLVAIFGYPQTYPGGETGQAIFRNFGRKLRSGPGVKLLDAWIESNGKTPWSAAFVSGAETMTSLDIMLTGKVTVDRNANGKYFSTDNPTAGRDLVSPEIIGYFVCRITPAIEDDSNLKEIEGVLDKDIQLYEESNLIEQLERNFLSIDPIEGDNYLFLRKADGELKGFKSGQEFLIKFYVVRPTWDKSVASKRVFCDDFVSGGLKQLFAHCKISFPCGITSEYMLISIVEDCESLKIRVKFQDGKNTTAGTGKPIMSAADYLLQLAMHSGEVNPSDLVMSIIPIVQISDQRTLPNSEKFTVDNISKFPWKDHQSVMDLRAFPCRLKPSGEVQPDW